MATLVLQAAGAALFGGLGPVGAAIGGAAGAIAGSAIDGALFSGGGRTVEGSRLAGARIAGADAGTGVARVYGTMRVGGMLFWATRFEEEATSERAGGKAASGPKVKSYRYYANFALGLCEGEIGCVRRVWADGKELDTTELEMRVYRGTADQMPDPLIEAKQGAGKTPAYRNLTYVVFERLPLDDYGNRIPVLQFEVLRPVGRLEADLRAVTLIPGASEHGYDPAVVTERAGPGEKRLMNRNVLFASSDWQASLDELQALCPKLEAVALVVSWFGDDLRAEACRIRPGVEVAERMEESRPWSVGGIGRAEARAVSTTGGGPSYGGTPDDRSVIDAIRDLKKRGLDVFLYPFVMMDVPSGNGLPDPYGGAEQAAFPWRGRITCMPAPGRDGSPDRSAAIGTAVDAFCGSAKPGDFHRTSDGVRDPGGGFGYRRMILHYAHLAAVAGGVSGFIVGSELRGLSTLRDEKGGFPFVGKLVRLAQDVRSVLGPETALTYAADWSEYFGHHPADGSGDVFFHLDALWASPAIDAVGIDNYMPLSDWQDADLAEGNPDGFTTQADAGGYARMIAGGEGFDWYYRDANARRTRLRTPITDGLAGKDWVFRPKDLEGWWSSQHYDRVNGAERDTATAWVPKSKPIWFTELGCPAVDKGANQPNVFPDAKSSESALPYFSTGARNDVVQRRFLEAHLDRWTSEDVPPDMVDPARIFAWSFDARPFPAFPYDTGLWRDGDNWRTGHWLNGRLGGAPAPVTIAAILADHGFDVADVDGTLGDLDGFVQGDPASARALLEPLLAAYAIDTFETPAGLRFQSRGRRAYAGQVVDVFAERDDHPRLSENRGEETALPSEAIIHHFDLANDHEKAAARSRRLVTGNERQYAVSLPAAMDERAAVGAADLYLRERWSARRSLSFALSPASLALEPGDAVRLPGQTFGDFVVTRITDGATREIHAESFVPAVARAEAADGHTPTTNRASARFDPNVVFLDLPVLTGTDETAWARAAAYGRPFQPVTLSAAPGEEGYVPRATLTAPARIGTLSSALEGSATGRFVREAIEIDLPFGSLASAADVAVLNGANVLAVRSRAGEWEVLQFGEADEIAPKRWRLRRLLRAQGGTDDAMRAGADAGTPVVVLDAAVSPLGLKAEEAGLLLNWSVDLAGSAVSETVPFAGGARALTPLSPVHLSATRLENGDVALGWIRRGRINADSWLGPEIPLAEDAERYRVEIAGEDDVVRCSQEVAGPAFVYAADALAEDFAEPPEVMVVTVRQIGGRFGEGVPARARLAVRTNGSFPTKEDI
ncbi:baseplate multidomain protein megatron [Pararhizobium mangrovi]|uniref:Host specificity protein n=1 Tax=Pararhizobium mangrovi TaxID=2590452 RepID=A0A506UHH4_9HYPH|nr:glycoside hydrolase/phage tail family protein [Pararhizobium mangrovi]TPW32766.1 hypothetical protein FJU11_00640 [Pararhizobium mangrovi]